jgi:hypothetical protein
LSPELPCFFSQQFRRIAQEPILKQPRPNVLYNSDEIVTDKAVLDNFIDLEEITWHTPACHSPRCEPYQFL